MRPVTMKDVAARAGVSLQTVSNVINDRSSEMRPETRQRILRAMEELGYHPNAQARGLRSQRTWTIGFLTVDPSAQFLSDPFHNAIMSGMGDLLREKGYYLLVHALDPSQPGEEYHRLCRERRFDGAVLHLSGPQPERKRCARLLAAAGRPFVLVEEAVDAETGAGVLAENRGGAFEAVVHLHEQGHRRIAFLTPEWPWPALEERQAGYREALAAYGGEPVLWTIPDETVEAARAYAEAALRAPDAPTAILCSNDLLALGALQAARSLGRRVPEEVAVVGFDDFDFARFVDPPLTTVALPAYEMGRRAAGLLLGHVGNGHFETRAERFPVTLVRRGTA